MWTMWCSDSKDEDRLSANKTLTSLYATVSAVVCTARARFCNGDALRSVSAEW